MTLAHSAMLFAREAHKKQKRKYTGQPCFDHLAEVVGIAMSVGYHNTQVNPDVFMSVCWCHDTIEDCGVTRQELKDKFGDDVMQGVFWLSDIEEGNRATRKQLSRGRLSLAPDWVQTIKCADLISNTSSICQFDPKFAVVYLEEKRALLEVLTKADKNLWSLAWELANQDIV